MRPPLLLGTALAFMASHPQMNFINRALCVLGLSALLAAAASFAAAPTARSAPREIIAKAMLAENDSDRLALIGSLVGQGDEAIKGLLSAWKEDALFIYTAPNGTKIPI